MGIYWRVVDGSGQDPLVERMRDMPETAAHPLFHRVLQLHNTDNPQRVTFSEFANAMSSLSPRATLEERLRMTFSLFDHNNSGTLDWPEMFQLLRMMLGTTHDDCDLQAICNTCEQRFPEGLDFEAFGELVAVTDVDKLTLNL